MHTKAVVYPNYFTANRTYFKSKLFYKSMASNSAGETKSNSF